MNLHEAMDAIEKIAHDNNFGIALVLHDNSKALIHVCSEINSQAVILLATDLAEFCHKRSNDILNSNLN